MNEIKPGPELDRAVAKAVGLRRHIAVGWTVPPNANAFTHCSDESEAIYEELGADDSRLPDAVIPKYSTDLNAAYAAAEKAGLWNDHLIRKNDDGLWEVWHATDIRRYMLGGIGGPIVAHSTPALAICAAILKVKE